MLKQFYSFYLYFTLQNFLFGCFLSIFSSFFLHFSYSVKGLPDLALSFLPSHGPQRIFSQRNVFFAWTNRQTYRQTDKQTDTQIERQTDRQTDRLTPQFSASFLPYLLPSDSLTPLASGLSAYGLTPFLSICILTFLSVRLSFFLVNLWQKWLRNNEVIFQQKKMTDNLFSYGRALSFVLNFLLF